MESIDNSDLTEMNESQLIKNIGNFMKKNNFWLTILNNKLIKF